VRFDLPNASPDGPVTARVQEVCAGSRRSNSARGLLPFRVLARFTNILLSQPESDDALMARFCDGDQDAFAVLYDRYAPQLELFLRRFVRDRALAEDLLQTTFLSVVRARGRYTPMTGLRGWIYAIAANASRDALRRRGARPEQPYDPALLSDLASTHDGKADGVSDPNVARAVDQALQQLPQEQREAVLLHKLQGLSFPEIACALGTTVGAAKVRAHRGYQRLKILLAPWENA
jgi:RNA polymerase sigma-70 factor (ECF subfamily)